MMHRREFIKTGIAALGGIILPWGYASATGDSPTAEGAPVWMATGHPREAALKLAEAVNLQSAIPAGGVVLVKPNIAFPTPPHRGATTDPDFLSAILDACIASGARRIIVIDHPVGTSAKRNLKVTGIGSVCEEHDEVQVMIASERRFFQPVEIPRGRALKQTETAKILDKVDLFINVPTAKHHSAAGVSLGLKNAMGLIWDRAPLHQEMDLNQAIADLATVIRPQITFLDAHYTLLTNGPVGPGQTEETGKYFAGFDPVAVDAIGVEAAPFAGRKQKGINISHIKAAAEFGLGEADRENIALISV